MLRLSVSLKTKLHLSSFEEDEDSAICKTKLHISSSHEDEDYETQTRRRKRLQMSLTAHSSEDKRLAKKSKSSNDEKLLLPSDDSDINHPISSTPVPQHQKIMNNKKKMMC